jgi:L-ascorbate metabolism protein UlaG (beta-lactamase superfamily)
VTVPNSKVPSHQAKHPHKDKPRRRFLEAALLGAAAGPFWGRSSKNVQASPNDAKSAPKDLSASNSNALDPADLRLQRKLASPQFQGGKFRNPLPVKNDMWLAMRKWLAGGQNREPQTMLPVVSRNRSDFDTPPPSGTRVTWLGHASMLVEMGGRRFLTDPVFGERASPSRFVGPRRFFEPPLPVSQMPALDAVVLSHDHFDHLCEPTFSELKNLNTQFYVPLGLCERLMGFGVPEERIREFDWWESVRVGEVELAFVPARHFSGRSLFDRDSTLWGGWAFVSPAHRVFFSGDGGMFPGFKEIGKKYGPFDLTMMESGAYDASWADVHMGPEQALQAHLDVQGKLLMPIHWATFNLALHAWTEPGERLLAGSRERGVKLVLPRPGESFEPSVALSAANLAEPAKWWPDVPWKTAQEAPVVSSGLG